MIAILVLRPDDQIVHDARNTEVFRQLLIGVINAAKVVEVQNNILLRASLLACDILLADGQSVVWASKFLGHPLPERIAGIDLFERLLELAHQHGRYLGVTLSRFMTAPSGA